MGLHGSYQNYKVYGVEEQEQKTAYQIKTNYYLSKCLVKWSCGVVLLSSDRKATFMRFMRSKASVMQVFPDAHFVDYTSCCASINPMCMFDLFVSAKTELNTWPPLSDRTANKRNKYTTIVAKPIQIETTPSEFQPLPTRTSDSMLHIALLSCRVKGKERRGAAKDYSKYSEYY
eukprot:2789874-Amphidinium_carterae.1